MEETLYRGQSDETFQLIPSLGRGKKAYLKRGIIDYEANMIEMAKNMFPDVFKDSLSPVELLALSQHYGIPTRLLDVTGNPLVALYFACSDNETRNGEVIIFKNEAITYRHLPLVKGIAESYKFIKGSWCDLREFYGNIANQPYFLESKFENEDFEKEPDKGAGWIEKCCESLVFLHAPNLIVRQKVQCGRYILFPNKIYSSKGNCISRFVNSIEPVSKDRKEIIGRIMVPAEYKKSILEELYYLGISRKTLFADSIDIVCECIKNDFIEEVRRK